MCSLVPCGNHAQLGGGSDAERVRSTLAYGWVERCSDIASCREASSQDKYSCIQLFNCICFVNYHEHVKCLNRMNVACFMSMNSMYVNA